MEEYPSNSKTQPAETGSRDGRVQSVITNPVVIQKPGLGKRLVSHFKGNLHDEDGRSVFIKVLHENIIPSGRDVIADAARDLLDLAIYGESRGPRRSGNGNVAYNLIANSLASKVNYSSPSVKPGFMTDPRERQPQQKTATLTRGRINYEDILLATRVEADEIIKRMIDLIAKYGQVTIADLFDLVGVTGEYTDEKFGWVELHGARPSRTNQGYALNLPRPVQLNS